ncbi:MAG: 30S ribosomal protein S6 [Nitrospirota bacterium]
MKDYESIFILSPSIDEAEAERISQRMQEVVKSSGGEVVRVERWGKRKLAYPVKKHKKGEYILLQLRGVAGTVTELERNYKMTEAVIKYLTVHLEKEALAHLARTLQAQQQAQEAAALRAAAAEAQAGEPAAATPPEPEQAQEGESTEEESKEQ